MKSISVGAIADWILENRKGNAFKDDTFHNLCHGIFDDIRNGTILYSMDEKDNIIGIITFKRMSEKHTIYVKNLLITRHAALACFIHHFRTYYNGFTIRANRKDTDVTYNTHRLNHLLITMKGKQ